MLINKTGIAPTLYQLAYEALAKDIQNGRLQYGNKLTETAIAERFGISRAPARQALVELEKVGFVKRAETRGYEVQLLDKTLQSIELEKLTHSATEKLSNLSSWELIYDEIETEIVSRTSLASWRINEVSLGKYYGVSRTVARDVISRLHQRGIIRKDDKNRWFAPALSEQHINELYELRWILEPIALEKAYINIDRSQLIGMRNNVASVMRTTGTVSGEKLDQLENELHILLLSYCQNETLMRAISLPQSLLVAHHFLYKWTSELFDSEPFLPEHLLILDQLLEEDIEAAKDSLAHHLQISRTRAMKRIKSVAAKTSPDEISYLQRLDNIG